MKVSQFVERLGDHKVLFHIVYLDNCVVAYAGDPQLKSFDNLAMAMPSRFDATPLGTTLRGDPSDIALTASAQRLSKKTGMQCFVSFCLDDGAQAHLKPVCEKRLLDDILRHKSEVAAAKNATKEEPSEK